MTELSAEAPREKTFLLAEPEARVLTWIARRLPSRILPDHLTALGVLSALGVAVSYLLSNDSSVWLLVGAGLLVLQWLGDSLDGTLARTRKTERPRYGYYLDHLVDAVSTALIGIGLGLSPHLLVATGLLIVVAYLVLSINTYLETSVFGVFELGYGRVGPTEARLALVGMNIAMACGAGLSFTLLGVGVTVLDVVAWVIAGGMLLALGVRAAKNLRTLAAAEPAATPRAA
ncbi:MAG: CDP-alcohol phosphatidyltransferase [Solirubrobacterales bacterium]|nr:CDP-alcohol phosphatidyltransferase [Solirubrobacterales bacterium]